jgi:hypothetical protein
MGSIVATLLAVALHAAPVIAKPESLLPPGSTVLQRLETDLDGDGVAELVLVGGVPESPDPDSNFNGTFEVRVLARAAGGWRDAGKLELVGVFQPVVVADVGERADRARVLLAAAGQCGGSCSGFELHAGVLRGGRLVPIGKPGEPLMLYKGRAIVFPGKFVETWTRHDDGTGPFAECCPSAFRGVRYVIRGSDWVAVESADVWAEEAERAWARPTPETAKHGWMWVANRPPGPILPAELLAARDWLVRLGRSVGKVKLGMGVAEVHALLGKPVGGQSLKTAGVAVERWGDRNPLLVWFDDGRVAQIAVTSPRFATATGLRAGASLTDVRKEFPQEDALRPSPGPELLDTFSGIAFVISAEPVSKGGGRVRALVIHAADAGVLQVVLP